MNNQQSRNSLKKNNESLEQLVSENADFESLTAQELKLTDDDRKLTDDDLEEVVGGFLNISPF
ncbi:hypothetical protein BJP36_15090 [Moorena producens JHB]|uniref:Bacteriocin n=1 Tax=Moorena producens (strain JHB) TaxID=1454205 RepID=A0A1D9G0C1_MOOP1|nr:hypothetical protein [Moorena producens]AOY81031.2 hypothetical protein BJP36_15090 [Moorena producens JHB]